MFCIVVERGPNSARQSNLVQLGDCQGAWEEAEQKAFKHYEHCYRSSLGAVKMTLLKTTDTRDMDMMAFQAKAEDNLKQEQARQAAKAAKEKRGEGPVLTWESKLALVQEDEGQFEQDGVTYTRTHMGLWEMHDSFGEDFRQTIYFKNHLGTKYVFKRKTAGVPTGYEDLDHNDGKTTRVGK